MLPCLEVKKESWPAEGRATWYGRLHGNLFLRGHSGLMCKIVAPSCDNHFSALIQGDVFASDATAVSRKKAAETAIFANLPATTVFSRKRIWLYRALERGRLLVQRSTLTHITQLGLDTQSYFVAHVGVTQQEIRLLRFPKKTKTL